MAGNGAIDDVVNDYFGVLLKEGYVPLDSKKLLEELRDYVTA